MLKNNRMATRQAFIFLILIVLNVILLAAMLFFHQRDKVTPEVKIYQEES